MEIHSKDFPNCLLVQLHAVLARLYEGEKHGRKSRQMRSTAPLPPPHPTFIPVAFESILAVAEMPQ